MPFLDVRHRDETNAWIMRVDKGLPTEAPVKAFEKREIFAHRKRVLRWERVRGRWVVADERLRDVKKGPVPVRRILRPVSNVSHVAIQPAHRIARNRSPRHGGL